ncbi:MAG: CidA/LrgA family protein [Proteobacteria bacterium]|nr:MAG: CidA/LrgA family protein [Pseudomonadota bacterium]
MNFLNGFTILLIYQLVGEFSVLYLKLPIPGPVMGMILLFVTLLIRRRTPESLDTTATSVLSHLSLLFIPAGVGIMTHFERIGHEWLPITAAILLSAILTIIATAWIMQGCHLLLEKLGKHNAN